MQKGASEYTEIKCKVVSVKNAVSHEYSSPPSCNTVQNNRGM